MKFELNGLLLVDKPTGLTSHDVVAEVRRILSTKSVGHTGTLDPLATGLMVMLLGQATKLSDYVLSQDKRYRVAFRLGVTTDSGDRTGAIVESQEVSVDPAKFRAVLHDLQGLLELKVPIYSAIKVKGQKLYEMARRGEAVAAPVRPMRFYDLKILELESDRADVEISCSKGGYIRSWVTAVGESLGVGATVDELRRIETAPYQIADTLTLETLKSLVQEAQDLPGLVERLGPAFVPLASALPGWRRCSVKGREEILLRNGQISHDLVSRLVVEQKDANRTQAPVGIKVLGAAGELLGLLEALPSQGLKIRRIFATGGS